MIWRCDLVPQYEQYSKQINDAISRVLSSGRYILATEVANFEKEFAAYVGAKHAIGVANGTDALTISLMALGIEKGDEVITTPFTAIPTVSAIVDAGATPVFVDICEDSYLMDIEKVHMAITEKTKAVIPVHIFGNVVDITRLRSVTGNNIAIVEDACQSHGSTLNGVQSGNMGDVGTFSFYPTKNLGAYGDGGMVVTSNDQLAIKLRRMRMYGMTDYNHIEYHGINSRLDELQAAILSVKLKYLDEMNLRRQHIAQRYMKELRKDAFVYQQITSGGFPNYHVFVARFLGNRGELIRYLDQREIQTNVYYLMPLHLQEANKYLGMSRGDLPISEKICDQVIALPLYAELPEDKQTKIIQSINSFIS